MQRTISVSFDSVDEADRAVARLRRSFPGIRADRSGGKQGSLPAEAPFTASVYYPWRMNMALNDGSTLLPEPGSRAIYTSDLMGLPIYHDGEARLLLTMDASDTERVRAMLFNLGGHGIELG